MIIFVLAFGGMPNEVHFRLRKNHSTGVKFVMGGLFLLLFPFFGTGAFSRLEEGAAGF